MTGMRFMQVNFCLSLDCEFNMKTSFIVIARNEEKIINKSLSSIANISIPDVEVICVDSASSDKTLEVMCSWRERISYLKIRKIVGDVNASIARNVGIREASGDVIYFIDSDVEITEDFLVEATERLKNKEVGAVVGQLKEYQYSDDYKHIDKKIKDRNGITKEVDRKILGGIFITRKDVVENIGEFDELLKYQEDTDYSLRISREYRMIGLPLIMGVHHTIPRHQKNRLKEWLHDRYGLYVGAVFIKNIRNRMGLLKLIANEKGMLSGFFLYLILLLLSAFINLGAVAMVFSVVVFFDIIQAKYRNKNISHVLLTRYIMPLYFVIGLAFFDGKKKKYIVEEVCP